ncbi:MAG TPA: glycosyltransferase family 4 protein [Planctomycetota bacterium]
MGARRLLGDAAEGVRVKITFVVPDYSRVAGGMRVIAEHARRLRRRGHEVVVVATPGGRPSLVRRVFDALRGRGPGGKGFFEDGEVQLRLLDRFRTVTDADVPDADVVVATWWKTAPGVAALSPRKGAKALFIQGYELEPGRTDPALDATWRMPMRKIVVAKWLKNLAAARFDDPRALLVPNGVDARQFDAPRRARRATPTAGLVYWRLPMKGTDVSLDAVRRARRDLPGLKLVAFGMDREGSELPLPSGTVYHREPAQAAIPGLYASCDAWLWGSRQEGFGLPLLEAMACRTPVVASTAGAAPEILERAGGAIVPTGDPQAMADAIVRILRMPERQWSELSEAARETASAWSWERSSGLFEDAIRRAREEAPA